MKTIYLDNNSTTPLLQEVKEGIIDILHRYGNPSSMHTEGRAVQSLMDDAIKNIADFYGCNPRDMIFTSCATESNNMIMNMLLQNKYDYQPHIIISNIEHPSIYETAKYLEKNGVAVTYAKVSPDGVVDPETVKREIRSETKLISVMFANNEIGTIQPIEEIGKIAHEKNIFFHTDAVQASGKIPFSLKDFPVDAASFSAHKMYAPKGIGLLYVKNLNDKKGILKPLLFGGHQARGFRAGTENTFGIIAYGIACKVMKKMIKTDMEHMRFLRDTFEELVVNNIPDIIINGGNAPRKVDTSNISFKYIEGESILLRLDLDRICVSTGSACSTGSLEPSHVIMAIANKEETAHGSVRFSFGRENTLEEVKFAVQKLEETVTFLRKISPLTPK